jgi:hypothetical protein
VIAKQVRLVAGLSILSVLVVVLVVGCLLFNSAPVASFTFHLSQRDPPCVVDLDASASYDQDGIIVAYGWSFGDGSSGADRSTSHVYTTSGTYTITLVVTDDKGKTTTAGETITVLPSYTPPPPPPPTPPIILEITGWIQDYTAYSDTYCDYVYVYYTVTSTGVMNINSYAVWIELRCADGSSYQGWASGCVGRSYVTACSHPPALIYTAGKRVISASVTRYEVHSY